MVVPAASAPTGAAFPPHLLPTLLSVSLAAVGVLRPVYEGAELADFTVDYLNPAGQRLLGLPAAGATLRTRLPPSRGRDLLAFCTRVFATGETARSDGRYPAAGPGRYFHVAAQRQEEYLVVSFTEAAGHPRPAAEDANGPARGAAAHGAAEAQYGELESLFACAPVAVAVLRGPRYVVEWINEAACALGDRRPAQARGAALFELLPEAAGQGFEALLDQVLATGEPYVGHELPFVIDRHGRRETAHLNFVYQPLREASGNVTRVLVMATEVTKQLAARQRIRDLNVELATANEHLRLNNAQLEQRVAARTHALLITLEQLEKRGRELSQALAAAQELSELKSRFVSMASHEFRTPLTVVLSSAALIAKYPGHAQQAQRLEHLGHIRTSVRQLNDVLEELLAVGQLQEGKIETHPASLDVGALLAETAAYVQPLLRAGQRIDQAADCAGPFRLDGSLLRKILLNLLSNASKYSGEGARITVRAVCQPRLLTLTVQDEGVGIAAADQAHLFEQFFRARSAASVPGTGLGLFIIAQYLELMGGRIALQSAANVGTTFTLTFPYENHSAD